MMQSTKNTWGEEIVSYLTLWFLVSSCVLGYVQTCSSGEIHDLVKSGNLNKVKTLLQEKPDLLKTLGDQKMLPLHVAAREGKTEILKFLLALTGEADIDAVELEWGNTALHLASGFGRHESVKLLIEKKADVNAQALFNEGMPLHFAALGGYLQVCETLMKAGAKLNSTDKSGATPLHYAVREGHAEIVELLVEAGAQIDVHDAFGKTPEDEAIRLKKGEIAKFLMERGRKLHK